MSGSARVGALLFLAAAAHAQVLDAVVARVDQSVITWSEVLQEFAIRTLAGEPNGAADARTATEALVRRRLLVANARKMGLAAPASEVEAGFRAVIDGAGGAEPFGSRASRFGVTPADVTRRTLEVVLLRRYLALRLEMTYVPESEVRAFYSQQVDVLGGRPLVEIREDVRSFLARKKYQQQLNEWIARQVEEGRVEVMEPAGGWPPMPGGP